MAKSHYQLLQDISKSAAIFSGISSLLEWDQETYMPKEGIEARSSQIEKIAGLVHKEKTSKRFGKLLSQLIDLESGQVLDATLTEPHRAALREWRRDYLRSVKLPSAFVQDFAKTGSASMHAWSVAKQKGDFKLFLPHLKKVVSLCRKKADILGYTEHPYDALVDLYEPEMKTSQLTLLFGRLKIPLTNLLKSILARPQPDLSFLHKSYAHEKQTAFGKLLLEAMGFDKSFSRLDESVHPMCVTVHPRDIRMTTRIYPNLPLSNILSVIHEGGHGLYEAGLPTEEYGTPLCEAASLGIHESQSRLWESIIGRGLPFWRHFFPLLQEAFPEHLAAVRLEEFHHAVNLVKASFIRVEADEVTYNLHIMVRFELEKALIEGSLKPEDVPDAWNEKMRLYLGISPSSDIEGCLQDIHWSMGGFGYFPTYALGNLYAAQFFEAFATDHPDWKNQISNGNLKQLRSWLNQKIHRFGRQYIPEELCERATGKPLSEKPFVNYLEQKYKPLYRLS